MNVLNRLDQIRVDSLLLDNCDDFTLFNHQILLIGQLVFVKVTVAVHGSLVFTLLLAFFYFDVELSVRVPLQVVDRDVNRVDVVARLDDDTDVLHDDLTVLVTLE